MFAPEPDLFATEVAEITAPESAASSPLSFELPATEVPEVVAPEPDLFADAEATAGPDFFDTGVTNGAAPEGEGLSTSSPDLFAPEATSLEPAVDMEGLTPDLGVLEPAPDLFATTPSDPAPLGDLVTPDSAQVAPAESAPSSPWADLVNGSQPAPDLSGEADSVETQLSSSSGLGATMEVAPALPEPTVELSPAPPSTPWADLIAAGPRAEAEAPEDEPAPAPVMPSWTSADWSSGASGTSDWGSSDWSTPAPLIPAAAPPDFSVPETASQVTPDFSVPVPSAEPISPSVELLVPAAANFNVPAPSTEPPLFSEQEPAAEPHSLSASETAPEPPSFTPPEVVAAAPPLFSLPEAAPAAELSFPGVAPESVVPSFTAPEVAPAMPSVPSVPEFTPPAEPLPTPLASSFEPGPVTPVVNPVVQVMGGQAEEILEDDFEFSAEAGPARPQWKGWGASEREIVQKVCENAIGVNVGKIPAAFAGPVSQALRSDVNKFQIVLGPGCGKSHLAFDLCVMEAHGPFGPAVLVEWPASHTGQLDGQELLSIYFQLREDFKNRGVQAVLPEPEAAAALATAVAVDGFASSFRRLLGQLAVLNKSGLTLLFDEPPEGVRQCLGAGLPGRLRVISLVTAMNSGPELGARVELQGAWTQAAVELFGPVVSEVTADPAANLLRVGLYVQLRAVGGSPPASLAEIIPAVLKSSAVDVDLLACLALEQKAVSLDDLDQWFLDPDQVSSCVESFPSLFNLRTSRLAPQLELSHHTVEAAVLAELSEACQKAASRLVGWVVTQLERTSADKYGSTQVRDIVYRNFCRLYRFATMTRSLEVLEWVARNKELQKSRVVLTTFLEKPAFRWELQKLLVTLAEVLSTLVADGRGDLRDELAWAYSHLGLNQLQMGLPEQALGDVVEALELFTTLVEKEKQHEFRPALATTLYRASKIADTLKRAQEARDYSERAVSDLVELVEDRGRSDLQARLGIAMALRGGLKNDAGDVAGALKDLQRASSLLATSTEDKQHENKTSQIELQLELSAIFLKAQDVESAVREGGKAVQLATQAVEELQLEELQPLLATCHTARARCYLLANETDRAQRDVSKSITLRNLAVDEGRLDQRFELSKEYLLRSQIDRGRGMSDDAGRDLSRAIEILEQLDSEGRRDAKRQLLFCLVERSELLLAAGEPGRSIEDLSKAFAVSQADTSGSPEASQARLAVLDGLLRAYLRAGDSDQALGVSGELLAHYQANQDYENYARVQVVRGDALERQANLTAAAESYNQAIGMISKLLEQAQTDERLFMVSDAYLGSGSVDLKQGNPDRAAEQVKRSLDIFTHLFQQRGMQAALPKLLKAYSQFAAVNLIKGKTQDAMVSLKSGFDILAYLEKEGLAAGLESIELRKAELLRARARALFMQGELSPALADSEEAIRNFLLDRQKNQMGPWKDELARTWVLRSSIFFLLKDFTQAEQQVQEAIAHFEEMVRGGKAQYFDDLMKALSTRAENAGKAGKIDRVLEEYGRMLVVTAAAGQAAGTAINVDLETARIVEKRARVYRDQSLFNEAYGDYESAVGLYRKLLSEGGRSDLAVDLTRIHLERGEMISSAGHSEHAIGDYSQAVDLAKALFQQGQMEAAPLLARALHRRADCFRATGKPREALADLEGAVTFQKSMAQQRQDVELMGNLARALLSQGTLLAGFQQFPQAAGSLDQAIGIFTQLVEQQQQRQFSSDMAQALIQRVSLTGDKTDPALRQILIRAVDLVTQQAREGKPVARDFPIDCLRAVVDLLTREDFDTVGDLIDAVLRLVELVVADVKSQQDFVKLTDLLLAASAGLIDDRRTARRPHFLALACVSCNREIQMFGKNSLPRLVYCLYELGQALERSKPPSALNYIGSSFALLGELASQQQNNEDFLRELKMMVTTWRSLPPQVPALANVSRQMLSALLRLV